MAGEVDRYIPSIAFKMKPAQSTHYHDNNKNTINIMEEYLSNEFDEILMLDMLSSDVKRPQALHYLDNHLHENNSVLIFKDKQALFDGFLSALSDSNQVCLQCTKLIAKIIPALGRDLDLHMNKILGKIVGNVGSQSVSLQKESVQTLHLYMKHSTDVYQILHAIAHDGILHGNPRTRQQIVHTFPTLLFAEFKDEDFFDIVRSLVLNLTESSSDKDVILQTLEKVKDFIGADTFTGYVNDLPTPLRHTYSKYTTAHADRNVDARPANRAPSKYSISDADHDDLVLKHTPTILDRILAEKQVTNFAKSGHFDAPVARRRQTNMYASLSLPTHDSHSSLSESKSVGNDELLHCNEIPFVSKSIVQRLSSSEFSIRLQAIEDLKDTLFQFDDLNVIEENIVPLVSLLQPMIDDKNYRVACAALTVLSVIMHKIGPSLNDYLKLFVFATSKKLGNVKDAVLSGCMKILLQAMEVVGPQKVLDLFWNKFTHKQSKVREEFVRVVIAALLTFGLKSDNRSRDINYDTICSHVVSLLKDNQMNVRRAVLECISVLGHILGPTSKILLNSINDFELQNEDVSGIMPVVHARLMRRQMPRLTENLLVEYAVFPPSTAPITSPQGADLQWIYAAEKSKKGASSKGLYRVQDNELKRSFKHDPKKSIENVAPEANVPHQPRRYLSAGKQRQFPWTSQEEPLGSKHPSSAPVSSNKHATEKQQPPFRPRNTWGPESELSNTFSALSSQNSLKNKTPGYEPTLDNGPSYQELYKRRKEANSNKPPIAPNHSSARSSDSVYKPSFASSGFSASSASTPTNHLHDASALSNSCPSTFFEKNGAARPSLRRVQKKATIPQPEDYSSVSSSAYGSEDSDSPIRLKPALARSASKRRENAANRDSLRPDDTIDKVPVKLKNASASPRFDRLVSKISVEQVRPMLKQSHNSIASSASDRFPGPAFSDGGDISSSSTISIGGYTPSGFQRLPAKENQRNDHSPKNLANNYDTDSRQSPKYSPMTNGNNNSNKTSAEIKHKIHTTSRPIVPSNFSPARHHRGSDDVKDTSEFQLNAVSAIRRSAQNKRERMRSQPGSEEFNSFSFPGESPTGKMTSSLLNDSKGEDLLVGRSISQPSTSNEVITASTVITEPPPFKYNPNTGVTFDPKKGDTDVSVIGIRYPGQGYQIHSTGGSSSDIRVSQPSPISTTSTLSNSNLSLLTTNKYSPNQGHDRHRSHRASALGMVSSSPDSGNNSINVQGKGVFMATSSTSLLSASDATEVSPTPSKDEHHARSLSNASLEAAKLIDGVCGVAVRQPSLTPEDIARQFDTRRTSDTEVSLSASLRQKQKEVSLTKNSIASPRNKLPYDFDVVSPTYSKRKSERNDDYVLNDSPNRNSVEIRTKLNKSVSPLNVSGSSQRGGYGKDQPIGPKTPKSGSAVSMSNVPLENPEKSLVDVISVLATTDSEEWEGLTQGIYVIQRLACHHPNVLASRFHDVITLLSKNVPNLRSQVSKASVKTITDVYTHLKKPTVDIDIDTTVRALLLEYGKPNSFIKEESNKTLQTMIGVATTTKILNALLNAGLRHRHKNVKSTTARFVSLLVDKIGPGKALSGIKDITDRLLDSVAVFVNDNSPDVRYYGRYIVNELMHHDEFEHCLDRFLSAKSAQDVKNSASSIKQRGLGSISSVGSRKMAGSVRRNGSSSASAGSLKSSDRFSPTSLSAHSRRKVAGPKVFNEMEQEELKNLCNELSTGNMVDRKTAIASLQAKLREDKRFVEDNAVKIMDAFRSLLATSNTKLNYLGLEALPGLIVQLHPYLSNTMAPLVGDVFKSVLSKQNGELALKNIDVMVQHIDPMLLVQPIGTVAGFSSTAKEKQIAIIKLLQIIDSVSPKKLYSAVLPSLWNLLKTSNTPSGVQLRKETVQLTQSLYGIFGSRLLELADSKNNNLSTKVQEILETQTL